MRSTEASSVGARNCGEPTSGCQTSAHRGKLWWCRIIAAGAATALLHQCQREIKTATDESGQPLTYLEAADQDLQLAQRLMQSALRRSLESLLPQTRELLRLLSQHVQQQSEAGHVSPHQIRLTQRQMRETFGWTDHQVRRHLGRLVQLEYVLMHRTRRGNQRHYELLWPVEEAVQDSRWWSGSVRNARLEQ